MTRNAVRPNNPDGPQTSVSLCESGFVVAMLFAIVAFLVAGYDALPAALSADWAELMAAIARMGPLVALGLVAGIGLGICVRRQRARRT